LKLSEAYFNMTALFKGVVIDATFIGFVIISIIQIITIITIMVFVLIDIKRKAMNEAAVSASTSIHDNSVKYVNGATPKMVAMYRKSLTKSGLKLSSDKAKSERERSRKLLHLLRDRGENISISDAFKQITSSIKDVEESREPLNIPDVLKTKLALDPYVNTSCVLSKFARAYSPMHAKTSWSNEQQMSELVVAPALSSGSVLTASTSTALVLPSGHVVNKAKMMTDDDRSTLALAGYTPECAAADIASRINIFGYHNAPRNEEAYARGETELHLCPCVNHEKELEAPFTGSYSQQPDEIVISTSKKRALLPGAGLNPVASSQAVISRRNESTGEYSIPSDPANVEVSEVSHTPAYGTSLVNLPVEGEMPIAVNCVCTDRADGEYDIGGDVLKYRDLAGWLNTNPLESLNLTRGESGSWLASGKPVSKVRCSGERIVGVV
jgi:hypothetical protein